MNLVFYFIWLIKIDYKYVNPKKISTFCGSVWKQEQHIIILRYGSPESGYFQNSVQDGRNTLK